MKNRITTKGSIIYSSEHNHFRCLNTMQQNQGPVILRSAAQPQKFSTAPHKDTIV